MKFMLYCDNNPRDLAIEDDKGNWDIRKLKDHIRTCRECNYFGRLMGEDFFDCWAAIEDKKKGLPPLGALRFQPPAAGQKGGNR